MDGITEEYEKRRLHTLLEYAKDSSVRITGQLCGCPKLSEFPVMNKADYNAHFSEILCDAYQGSRRRRTACPRADRPERRFWQVLCDGDKMNRINMNFISCMELNGFRMGMKRGEFRVWIDGKNTISKWKSLKTTLIMIDISNMGTMRLQISAGRSGDRGFRCWSAIRECTDSACRLYETDEYRCFGLGCGDDLLDGRGAAGCHI